jgi:hypothetical protein
MHPHRVELLAGNPIVVVDAASRRPSALSAAALSAGGIALFSTGCEQTCCLNLTCALIWSNYFCTFSSSAFLVDVCSMVLVGALVGLTLSMASVRYTETLFYQLKATDVAMLAFPSLAILAAALLAALPPVINAVRIDPVTMLRAE